MASLVEGVGKPRDARKSVEGGVSEPVWTISTGPSDLELHCLYMRR